MKSSLFFLFTFFISIQGYNQAGTLDQTFGDKGKVYTNVVGQCYAAALQPDGKILAGGGAAYFDYTLIRYLPNGELDSAFGNNGIASVDESSFGSCHITGIMVLSNNSIITSGVGGGNALCVKFKPDGKLDSAFAQDGSFKIFGKEANAIGVQPNGKIILAGSIGTKFEGTNYMLLMRLNDNGSIDSSFGIDGKVINDAGFQINCLALQEDGKIIAGGQLTRFSFGEEDKFVISRYNTDGSLDESFGTNSTVLTDVSNADDYPYSLAILNGGEILAAGMAHYAGRGNSYMTVVKYYPDGTLYETFGENGISNIVFGDQASNAKNLLVQQDGKLILTGNEYDNLKGKSYFALARLKTNGSLDSSFGIDGKQISDFGGREISNASVLQPDGKIILAGEDGESFDYILARYNNDEALPLHFTYFNVAPTNNGGIALNWQTAQENNNDYFTVERCGDSRFRGNDVGGGDEIARINSKGNASQLQTYSYTDNAPLQGTNFYRLKQVDKDGKFSYSQIVSATLQDGLSVILYPNPVRDVLNIQGLDAMNNYQLSINNAKGNAVASTQVNNTSSYKWNLQSLSKGVYYLNIVSNQKTTTVKFVKE